MKAQSKLKLLFLALTLVATSLFATACSLASTPQAIDSVANLKLNANCTLSWTQLERATSYEVTIGEQTYPVTEAKIDLTQHVTAAGEYVIGVKAVAGSVKSEAVSITITAQKLTAPEKPVIATDEYDHSVKFTWTVAEGAKYLMQINNNGKWLTNNDGVMQLQNSGDYVISVKQKGYAKENVLYIESDPSEPSDSYTFVKGPTLSLEDVCEVSWSNESDYDSFNVWINGELAKENVSMTGGVYKLTGGESPAITKTGEYDVQIEAVKDGVSSWSNLLKELGTLNINENEIYSFDNGIAKMNVPKDGVSVTTERYHGESGYSLKFDISEGTQVNIERYVDTEMPNAVDYTTVKTVSYWVYAEPIEGYTGEALPALNAPSFKWESPWTDKDGNATYKRRVFYADQAIPFGEWTKVTLDVAIPYDNVLLLSVSNWGLTDADGNAITAFVTYIDDIYIEAIENVTVPEDAEYVVEYDRAAVDGNSWQGFKFTEIDVGTDYANQTIYASMEVCGTADETFGEHTGLFNQSLNNTEPNYSANKWKALEISSSKLGSGEWTEVTVTLNVNADGKTYLTGMIWENVETRKPYYIFIKNVTPLVYDGTGTQAPDGEGKNNGEAGSEYRQSLVTVPAADLTVGTQVTVEMDIYITGTYNTFSYIAAVEEVYSADGGELKEWTKFFGGDNPGKIGSWLHVKFDTTVRSFSVLRLGPAYNKIETNCEKGVYLFAGNFLSANSFAYKNVTVTEKIDMGTAAPNGVGKKTSPNSGYRNSVVALPVTDLEVGTMVLVEMDIYVNGTFDQCSYIYGVETVWTIESGAIKNAEAIILFSGATGSANTWIHLKYNTTVRSYSALCQGDVYDPIATNCEKGVYLVAANFLSLNSFNYKNVSITQDAGTAAPDGVGKTATPNSGYRHAVLALPATDFNVDARVTVEMDIYITGTFDTYTRIYGVEGVWAVPDGETINSDSAIVLFSGATDAATATTWKHLKFSTTVKSLSLLRLSEEYGAIETNCEKGVYLVAANFTSVSSFYYKNVTITAESGTVVPDGGTKKNGYHQSIVGLKTDLAEGTAVTVEMEIAVIGEHDAWGGDIEWIDTVYDTNATLSSTVVIGRADIKKGIWVKVTFNAVVRNFSSLAFDTDMGFVDTSSVGTAVYIGGRNFTTADSFIYKNVTITAAESAE